MYYLTLNTTVNGTAKHIVLDSVWAVYPFASKGKAVLPNWDTTYDGTRAVSSGSIEYLGEQQITVAGETFDTKMARFVTDISMRSSSGNEVLGQSRIDTVWYAPRIYYYVRQRGWQENRSPFGKEQYYNKGDLKSYVLR
jgi:hypothetical protein